MLGKVSSHTVKKAGYFYKVCAIDDGRRRTFKKERRKYEREGKRRLINVLINSVLASTFPSIA